MVIISSINQNLLHLTPLIGTKFYSLPQHCSFKVVSVFTDAKGSIREIILPKGLDLDRPKRTRTSFTAEQLYRLEMEFQRCQYVVGRERTELARQLNLSETQVCIQVFFLNKYIFQIYILCKL